MATPHTYEHTKHAPFRCPRGGREDSFESSCLLARPRRRLDAAGAWCWRCFTLAGSGSSGSGPDSCRGSLVCSMGSCSCARGSERTDAAPCRSFASSTKDMVWTAGDPAKILSSVSDKVWYVADTGTWTSQAHGQQAPHPPHRTWEGVDVHKQQHTNTTTHQPLSTQNTRQRTHGQTNERHVVPRHNTSHAYRLRRGQHCVWCKRR